MRYGQPQRRVLRGLLRLRTSTARLSYAGGLRRMPMRSRRRAIRIVLGSHTPPRLLSTTAPRHRSTRWCWSRGAHVNSSRARTRKRRRARRAPTTAPPTATPAPATTPGGREQSPPPYGGPSTAGGRRPASSTTRSGGGAAAAAGRPSCRPGPARAVRLLGGGAGTVHCGAVRRCAPARGLLAVAAAPRGGAKGSLQRGRTARAAGAVRRARGVRRERAPVEPRRRSCDVCCRFCATVRPVARRLSLNAGQVPGPDDRVERPHLADAPVAHLRRSSVLRCPTAPASTHSVATQRRTQRRHTASVIHGASKMPGSASPRIGVQRDLKMSSSAGGQDDDENDALIERSGGDASPGGEKPGGPSALYEGAVTVAYCVVYLLVGPALILTNKQIMRDVGFHFPMLVSGIGRGVVGDLLARGDPRARDTAAGERAPRVVALLPAQHDGGRRHRGVALLRQRRLPLPHRLVRPDPEGVHARLRRRDGVNLCDL